MTEATTPRDGCWFCGRRPAEDAPPGGWLIDDDLWRAGHTPASYAPAGTVVLELRRHALDQAEFTTAELDTVGPVTGRLVTAIREVTGADRVYQWASMAAYPHFHLWLLPWWAHAGARGPDYLQEAVHSGGCTPDRATATAGALRDALERPSARTP